MKHWNVKEVIEILKNEGKIKRATELIEDAVTIINMANNSEDEESGDYEVVGWEKAFEPIVGKLKRLSPEEITKQMSWLKSDAFAKAKFVANVIQPTRPLMRWIADVEGKPARALDEKGDYIYDDEGEAVLKTTWKQVDIGFKIKTSKDRKYVDRVTNRSMKMAVGLFRNQESIVDENVAAKLITPEKAIIEKSILGVGQNGAKQLQGIDPENREDRQAILRLYDDGLISRHERDYRLSSIN